MLVLIPKIRFFFLCSDEFAGSDLLAGTTSSPEFFATLADTFYYHNSVGLGAVVGGCVFDLLLILGCCALATTVFGGGSPLRSRPLKLHAAPLLRDTFFVCGIFIWLAFAFWDGYFVCFEAAGLLGWYLIYIFGVWFATRPSRKSAMASIAAMYAAERCSLHSLQTILDESSRKSINAFQMPQLTSDDFPDENEDDIFGDAVVITASSTQSGRTTNPIPSTTTTTTTTTTATTAGATESTPIIQVEHGGHVSTHGGNSLFWRVVKVLVAPWWFLFRYTVPDCALRKWENWFVESAPIVHMSS